MAKSDNKKRRMMPDFEVHTINHKKPLIVKKQKYIRGERIPGNVEGTFKTLPGHFESYEAKVEVSWVVVFPRFHSIHITSPSEMIRLGFAEYEDEEKREGFVLKNPAITDHSTGLRLEGDSEIVTLLSMQAAKMSLKQMGRVPIVLGDAAKES